MQPHSPPETKPASKTQSPLVWVMTTNFAQGLPYMVVRILSTVYYTDIGAKERYLGYLNFLGIPWNFKFAWSPLMDLFATKRRWLASLQLLVALGIAAIAGINLVIPVEADPSAYLVAIALVLVFSAFMAASNDIAIDGYYLEGLPDSRDQAAYSGYRVLAYRLSLVFVRSGLVALAAWIGYLNGGQDKYRPWVYAFGAAALVMLALAVFHHFRLPRFETSARPGSQTAGQRKSFLEAFLTYLKRDRILLILLFIICYKMGDEIIFSMVTPFLMRELSLTKGQYAWIAGIVGAAGAIGGAMLGAWWIKSRGLKRAIWPLTLLMNLNIWAYIWLAWTKPDPATPLGIALIAAVHGYEQVAAGLGSAALTVFMMGICKAEYRATHYAIGSAIMSVASTVVGGFGGRIVEAIGYVDFFVLGFFATIPAMVMLFWVPIPGASPARTARS